MSESGLKRLPHLDGLRGLASIIVVLHHYFLMPFYEDKTIMNTWWARLLFQTWWVVDWFFVLSGWLIGTILLQNKNSQAFFKTFYIRRALRVLPMFLLLMSIFLILSKTLEKSFPWLFDDPLIPLWSYPLTLHSILGGHLGSMGDRFVVVCWSLVLEIHFYLVIPILIRYLSFKNYSLFYVGLIIIAIYLRYLIPGFNNIWERTLLILRPESIFGGVFLAHLTHNNFFSKKPWLMHILFLLFFPSIIFYAFDYPFSVFRMTFFGLTAVFFFGILISNPIFLKNILACKLFTLAGKISYSVYLLHIPIIGFLFQFFIQKNPQLTNSTEWQLTVLATLLSFLGGYFLFKFIEEPFLKLGQRYKY